jgi:hypothetical protein
MRHCPRRSAGTRSLDGWGAAPYHVGNPAPMPSVGTLGHLTGRGRKTQVGRSMGMQSERELGRSSHNEPVREASRLTPLFLSNRTAGRQRLSESGGFAGLPGIAGPRRCRISPLSRFPRTWRARARLSLGLPYSRPVWSLRAKMISAAGLWRAPRRPYHTWIPPRLKVHVLSDCTLDNPSIS